MDLPSGNKAIGNDVVILSGLIQVVELAQPKAQKYVSHANLLSHSFSACCFAS
jgi:hypothetical protein